MKKLLIVLLAMLMLTGCGKQEAPVQPPVEEPEVIHTPVEEEQIVAQPEQDVEQTPEEPRDWTPEQPSQDEGVADTFGYGTEKLEGLIEDTIGYTISYPQFEMHGYDGKEQINAFYEALALSLEQHTKENVYPQVMERHCIANVFGEVTAVDHEKEPELVVSYEYRVEFSDSEEPAVFIRTDYFDMNTGECTHTQTQ